MTDTITADVVGEDRSSGGAEVRLGRVERAILAALPRDGGFVPRDAVVRSAFPGAKQQGEAAELDDAVAPPACGGRALAEAAVSRAIASLQRKGLLVRDRNRDTGRTLLRSSAAVNDPAWELVARAEEDFSARALARAQQWRSLSARARARAARIRVDRCPEGTEDERRADMALAGQGEVTARADSDGYDSSPTPIPADARVPRNTIHTHGRLARRLRRAGRWATGIVRGRRRRRSRS